MTPTREQMELAAKACGIERLHFDATGTAFQVKGNVIGSSWRPLTSGDDSQRLQAKLRMDTNFYCPDYHYARARKFEGDDYCIAPFNPAIPDDDLRAMREAVFLVAVEIGRAK